jgi:hypothetical protein
LSKAAGIATDRPLREANFARSGLQRDWSVSLAPALERLAAWTQA